MRNVLMSIWNSLKSWGNLNQYKKINTAGSRNYILYDQCKDHKTIVDVSSPFRPVSSAMGMPKYRIEKFLVSILDNKWIHY